MSNNSHYQFHLQLLLNLQDQIKSTPPFNGDEMDELQAGFLKKLNALATDQLHGAKASETGQWLLSTIVGSYPHIMPKVPRDLLWYFGGDCMHFLGDEEITYFQARDEAYHEAETSAHSRINFGQFVASFEHDKQLHE